MDGYRSLQLRADCPFDVTHTVACGQAPRWEQIGDWWYGVVGDSVIKTRQTGDQVCFSGCSEKFFENYFSWDYNLLGFYDAFAGDQYLSQAIRENHGLRIIHQDPWECVCFQLSINKARVVPGVDSFTRISRKLGDKIELDGRTFYTFPDAGTIVERGLPALKSCNLGYKAENIFLAAKKVVDNPLWAQEVAHMDVEDARSLLTEFKGVKPLVAEWILLFAFGRYELFPVDSHIRDIIRRLYLSHVHFGRAPYAKMDKFIQEYASNHFGEYSGYVLEYLFASRHSL
ncbi:DNA-3-methyladenine glycosylase family protein [Methanofollis ethanolicus]|uniref:DNA-3-methyladenine glycosylase family protein n=1 Tax=Methanofollis ethanolicus TaxID=488124 RepID=UPI00082E3D25|nr:DNA glycosylase [Methanofollis ethanolicus]